MNQLGQHFLTDEEILKKETELLEIQVDDKIVEVGAGHGNLTKHLKKAQVTAIEIDSDFEKYLSKLDGIKLIMGNALDELKILEYNKIISNLPYHISEPLFHIIIKKEPEVCVFISGTRFYKILTEETKIGIGIRAMYDIEKIMDVDKDKFSPEPGTNSVLFVMKKKKQNEKEKMIKEILQQEDKTVKNALVYAYKRVYSLNNKEAKEKIKNIEGNILAKRVMHLSNVQFLNVVKLI